MIYIFNYIYYLLFNLIYIYFIDNVFYEFDCVVCGLDVEDWGRLIKFLEFIIRWYWFFYDEILFVVELFES